MFEKVTPVTPVIAVPSSLVNWTLGIAVEEDGLELPWFCADVVPASERQHAVAVGREQHVGVLARAGYGGRLAFDIRRARAGATEGDRMPAVVRIWVTGSRKGAELLPERSQLG